MAFDDFVLWFNVLFVCRMADDRWTRLTIKSKWEDGTAGGCCPNYTSWRTNPQWLLKTSNYLRLTLSLSIPQPAADGAGESALFPPDVAIGVSVLRGNTGADARRRKLLLTSPEDLVVRAEPRPVRRLVSEIALEPSEIPYVIVPHTFMPGREAPFTLTIRADDENDDGIPDFQIEPVRPATDWCTAVRPVRWAAALEARPAPADELDELDDAAGGGGGPPGAPGFASNPQMALTVDKGGRFFFIVDQLGLRDDSRDEEGLQPAGEMPEIGVAILASADALADGRLDDDEILQNEHAAADAAMLACELAPSELPYCVVPYLVNPTAALGRHPELQCRVCVYADVPFTFGDEAAAGAGGLGPLCSMAADGTCVCWGLGRFPDQQNENSCPILQMYSSLKRMERGLDRQLKYLDTLTARVA